MPLLLGRTTGNGAYDARPVNSDGSPCLNAGQLRVWQTVVRDVHAWQTAVAAGSAPPPGRLLFVHRGAGVGKTHVLVHLRKRLSRRALVSSASTGAAAAVMNQGSADMRTRTIYNVLNLRVSTDMGSLCTPFNSRKQECNFRFAPQVHKFERQRYGCSQVSDA